MLCVEEIKVPTQVNLRPITILRRPVKSSNIAAAGFDPKTKTMHVEFHSGDVWEYTPVTSQRYSRFLKAESKGGYFQQHIKPNSEARKLSDALADVNKNRRMLADVPPIKYPNPSATGEDIDTAKKLLAKYRNTDLNTGKTVVATPVYMALLKCKKLMGVAYGRVAYCLWVACGKPDTNHVEKKNSQLFKTCCRLIAEASGKNTIGGQYVDLAIELAGERRI